MSTKITPKVKNKVWQDYTKNSNSKKELKQIFLGINPTNAYKKISLKLKKKLDEVKTNSSPVRKTLRPKIPKIKSPLRKSKSKLSKSSTTSPKRKTTKSIRVLSPKSPKRTISPKSPKTTKRRTSSTSKMESDKSLRRKSKKDKLSSVRLIKN